MEQTLADALRFSGRRAFKLSGESMARITAAHLAEAPRQSGGRADEEAAARVGMAICGSRRLKQAH